VTATAGSGTGSDVEHLQVDDRRVQVGEVESEPHPAS
jgi:hypothetical protein